MIESQLAHHVVALAVRHDERIDASSPVLAARDGLGGPGASVRPVQLDRVDLVPAGRTVCVEHDPDARHGEAWQSDGSSRRIKIALAQA